MIAATRQETYGHPANAPCEAGCGKPKVHNRERTCGADACLRVIYGDYPHEGRQSDLDAAEDHSCDRRANPFGPSYEPMITRTFSLGEKRRNGIEINQDDEPVALVYGESIMEARALAERIVALLNAEQA